MHIVCIIALFIFAVFAYGTGMYAFWVWIEQLLNPASTSTVSDPWFIGLVAMLAAALAAEGARRISDKFDV